MSNGKMFIKAMGLVPKKPLSRTVRRLASLQSQMAVRRFAARYQIAIEEAERPLEEYTSVLDLFTRRLRVGARPLDPDPLAFLSPVDAKLDQVGRVERGTLIQAKGRNYSLGALLANDALAERFEGGTYATLYLAPTDYHRIHSPIDGQVVGSSYVPGELWPVNAAAVLHVDELFARNERIITHLESEAFGRVALVMVGATCVGHMRVSYDDSIMTNSGSQELIHRTYESAIWLERGGDLGVFEMGSTVIVVVEPKVTLDETLSGASVKMGSRLGRAR